MNKKSEKINLYEQVYYDRFLFKHSILFIIKRSDIIDRDLMEYFEMYLEIASLSTLNHQIFSVSSLAFFRFPLFLASVIGRRSLRSIDRFLWCFQVPPVPRCLYLMSSSDRIVSAPDLPTHSTLAGNPLGTGMVPKFLRKH